MNVNCAFDQTKRCTVPCSEQANYHSDFRFFHTMQKSFRAHLRLKLYFITTVPFIGAKFCKIFNALFIRLMSANTHRNPYKLFCCTEKNFSMKKFLSLASISLFSAELQYIRFYLLSLVLFIGRHKSYDLPKKFLCVCEVRKYSIAFQ